MSPQASNAFCSNLGSIQETVQASVTELYARRKDAHWNQWVLFCLSQGFDPLLQSVKDPIPILQAFAKRLHDGRLSYNNKPLQSHTVLDTIHLVGQTLAHMGSKDPRTNSTGSLDFRLSTQFKGYYAKLDPASSQVKPVPITLVMHALWFAYYNSPSPPCQAIANMICIAFFFCLCPDVSFYLGSRIFLHIGPVHELHAATSVTLTITTQKNGDKGKVGAHARSGDSLYCPVAACARQVLHLRSCCPSSSSPFSPTLQLTSYISNGAVTLIPAETVTSSLMVYAQTLYHTTGIPPAAISAQSLQARGAVSLLQGKCNSNVIKLLARWHSDCMMRYLYQQPLPVFKNLVSVIGCQPLTTLHPAALFDSSIGMTVPPLLSSGSPPDPSSCSSPLWFVAQWQKRLNSESLVQEPLMWRSPFPWWVPSQLVSFDNPNGTITNSDLELDGYIAHNDVLAHAACVDAGITHNCYNNTAAVYWQRKGATTTTEPVAYLLRIQYLHQWLNKYAPLGDYIPGPVNHLADLLLHSSMTTDTALLHHFSTLYPQDLPWILCSLRPPMLSALTLALSRRPCTLQSLSSSMPEERMTIGTNGSKRLHDGSLSCSNMPLQSCMVSDTIRSVGQRLLSCMGSKDPRTNNSTSRLDFRLTTQFKGYAKLDPAPSRVKKPYTGTTGDDQAFLLQDVSFYLGSQIVQHNGPIHELQAATSVTLTFTTQKNGDKEEVVAHARSGDSLCCPVAACACQVLHLRSFCPSSSPFSPALKLASYISKGVLTPAQAETVLSSMRVYAQTLYHVTGIAPVTSISGQSLRAGDVMALLQGKCDSNVAALAVPPHHQVSCLCHVQQWIILIGSFLPEEWKLFVLSMKLPPCGLWPNDRKDVTANKGITANKGLTAPKLFARLTACLTHHHTNELPQALHIQYYKY
eukprot:jgi/Psemu1/23634/gm1.23634_g